MKATRPRILVLDDDPHVRKTLTDILRLKGYDPLPAQDGGEAIALARQGFFNLALIDLKLPDMSGLDVMARIKSITPLTETIILTGNASLDSAIEATNQGAFSYLLKPYKMDDLLLNIRHGIDRQMAQEEILRLASHPRLNPNVVIDFELGGELAYVNPATEKRFPELAALGFRHPLLEGLDIGLLQQKGERGIVREVTAGEAIYEEHVSYIPESRLIRVYAMDITARKRAEQEKEQLQFIQDWKNKILEMLAKGASLTSLLEEITLLTEMKLGDASCAILLVDQDGKHLSRGVSPHLPGFFLSAFEGLEIGPEAGSCGAAAYTKQRVIVEDVQQHPCWSRFRELATRAGIRACWSEPILSPQDKVLGTFALYYPNPRTQQESDIGLIHSMTNLAGIAIERKQTEQAIYVQATTDSLTGMANRREFGRILEYEISRAKRHGFPLSLIMYDVDHFKKVNDLYGHDRGDEVLKTLSGIAMRNIRTTDICCRWGGEEFLILAPQSQLDSARTLAEKLRQAIAGCPFEVVEKLTASFGVASLEPHDSSSSLIKRADDALYKAKKNGRNRVEVGASLLPASGHAP